MKKILVTTDLSKSSKAGLKFAIQLASQYEVRLVFFRTIELLIPTRWIDVRAKIYKDEQLQLETEKLEKFVLETYKECNKRPGKFDCVVRYGAPVSESVLDYAAEIRASFICMATRGAGKVKRLIGTHTSAVIRNSPIPVFAIPKNYKNSVIKEILYASDFSEVRNELRTVRNFAKKVDSSVSVLHYEYFFDPKASKETVDHLVTQRGLSDTKFHIEKFNWEYPIDWNLKRATRKFKADIVALFTNRKRSWFERVFIGSNSATASFDSLKPVLVYPKAVV
jgi:nucleotide-binding universal stress UspA family protein